jgi:hypothetical protein
MAQWLEAQPLEVILLAASGRGRCRCRSRPSKRISRSGRKRPSGRRTARRRELESRRAGKPAAPAGAGRPNARSTAYAQRDYDTQFLNGLVSGPESEEKP